MTELPRPAAPAGKGWLSRSLTLIPRRSRWFVSCRSERAWEPSVRSILEATAVAVGSAITREADAVLFLQAGPEIAVIDLKTGKIDCIISSMTATEERARSIAFSDRLLVIACRSRSD